MGIYFDRTINNRLRGVSRMESLEIILERYEGEPLCGTVFSCNIPRIPAKKRLAQRKNSSRLVILPVFILFLDKMVSTILSCDSIAGRRWRREMYGLRLLRRCR